MDKMIKNKKFSPKLRIHKKKKKKKKKKKTKYN